MPLQSALITDPESTFLIVAVPKQILDDRIKAEQTLQFLQSRGVDLPIALVTRDAQGAPTAYYRRGDLSIRLLRRPPMAMGWRDMPLS